MCPGPTTGVRGPGIAIPPGHTPRIASILPLVAAPGARAVRFRHRPVAASRASPPNAAQLIQCYRFTGERLFLDLAVTYIKAYDKYGWDEVVDAGKER